VGGGLLCAVLVLIAALTVRPFWRYDARAAGTPDVIAGNAVPAADGALLSELNSPGAVATDSPG
jgi:hypothetical protein